MDPHHEIPDPLRNLSGSKILGRIRPLFAHLHGQACRRDRAGNRTLHFDQPATLVMLAMFNPVARGSRALSQVSDLDHARKRSGVGHASLGSLPEAARPSDPELLTGVITEPAGGLRGVQDDPRLALLKNPLTAVAGTLIEALPRRVESAWMATRDGRDRHAWRLHLQFDVDRSVPARVELSGPANSGDSDEKAVLRKSLVAARCYVMDRWSARFTLPNAIVEIKSDYACRVRDKSRFEVVGARALADEAIAAGVTSDSIVRLGVSSAAKLRPDHVTRLVVARAEPHEKRGGRKGKTAGPSSDGELLLATDLLDVPAEIIGLIYQYRGTIEIFFRFFEQTLGCKHPLWEHPGGILLETYRAIIARLLINVSSGREPTRRTHEMPCHYFLGMASLEEVTAHLARREAVEAAKKRA